VNKTSIVQAFGAGERGFKSHRARSSETTFPTSFGVFGNSLFYSLNHLFFECIFAYFLDIEAIFLEPFREFLH